MELIHRTEEDKSISPILISGLRQLIDEQKDSPLPRNSSGPSGWSPDGRRAHGIYIFSEQGVEKYWLAQGLLKSGKVKEGSFEVRRLMVINGYDNYGLENNEKSSSSRLNFSVSDDDLAIAVTKSVFRSEGGDYAGPAFSPKHLVLTEEEFSSMAPQINELIQKRSKIIKFIESKITNAERPVQQEGLDELGELLETQNYKEEGPPYAPNGDFAEIPKEYRDALESLKDKAYKFISSISVVDSFAQPDLMNSYKKQVIEIQKEFIQIQATLLPEKFMDDFLREEKAKLANAEQEEASSLSKESNKPTVGTSHQPS